MFEEVRRNDDTVQTLFSAEDWGHDESRERGCRVRGGFPSNVGSVSPQICVSWCITILLACIVSCPSLLHFDCPGIVHVFHVFCRFQRRVSTSRHDTRIRYTIQIVSFDTSRYMQIHAPQIGPFRCEHRRGR